MDYAEVWRTGPPSGPSLQPRSTAVSPPDLYATPPQPQPPVAQGPVFVPMHSLAPTPSSPSVTNNFYPSHNHEARPWAVAGVGAGSPAPAAASSVASWPYFWPLFAIVVALAFFILYVVHVVSGRKTQRLLKKAMMRAGAFWQGHPPPPMMMGSAFTGSAPGYYTR